jgi:hypothetical protein
MSFKIDTSEVNKLVAQVSGYNEAIARAEYRAVNKVADKTTTASKRAIVSMVNLSSTYVSQNMSTDKAAMGRPVAYIKARVRPTKLMTFDAKIKTVAAPTATGSPSTGIPAGKKFAGVSVAVKRAGAAKMLSAPTYFLLRLKNNNGLGIFSRMGKLRHHYGPSVDQGFQLVINDTKEDVGRDLAKTFASQLDYELGTLK